MKSYTETPLIIYDKESNHYITGCSGCPYSNYSITRPLSQASIQTRKCEHLNPAKPVTGSVLKHLCNEFPNDCPILLSHNKQQDNKELTKVIIGAFGVVVFIIYLLYKTFAP